MTLSYVLRFNAVTVLEQSESPLTAQSKLEGRLFWFLFLDIQIYSYVLSAYYLAQTVFFKKLAPRYHKSIKKIRQAERKY